MTVPVQPDPSSFDPTESMELAWQGQRGDAGAVNELLTRYIPRLRRVIRVKVGPRRSRLDPEDILQETLIVASRRLHELDVSAPSSLYQWMARIADFQILNGLERASAEKRDPARERRIDLEESVDTALPIVSLEPTASQIFSVKELEQEIDSCVAELEPHDYREVVLMRDYYEADWETIRVKLHRPSVEAVRELYKRAKERLQELFGKRTS